MNVESYFKSCHCERCDQSAQCTHSEHVDHRGDDNGEDDHCYHRGPRDTCDHDEDVEGEHCYRFVFDTYDNSDHYADDEDQDDY